MKHNTILICGAYGQAGKGVIQELISVTDLSIIASGRNVERLELLKKEMNSNRLSVEELDVTNLKKLSEMCLKACILINCVGPYIESGLQIANIAIDSGVHYIDIAAEQEHFRRLQNLNEKATQKKLVLATGFGFYPGLSGLLLRKMKDEFKEAESCLMSFYQGKQVNADSGIATYVGAIIEMNYDMSIINNGKLEKVTPCGRIQIEMPAPFGKKDTMLWPQLEILSLKDSIKINKFQTSVKIGLGSIPSKMSVLIIRLLQPHKLKFTFRLLSKLMHKRNSRSFKKAVDLETDSRGIITISLKSHNKELKGHLISDSVKATSFLPVRALKIILTKKYYGLITPDTLFNSRIIFEEFLQANPSAQLTIV